MTERRSSVEDPTSLMTTLVEVTSSLTGSIMTSSASASFMGAVVFIGIVGTATNALILYAFVASKQHKKHALVFNQNALDLFSCVFLAITYTMKLCNVHLSGSLGHWLCLMLLNNNLLRIGLIGSIVNLAAVTVERYLRVVHGAWSKIKLRNWMIYSAVAFSWLSATVYNTAVSFTTSSVIDGVCYWSVTWESRVATLVHGIWSLTSFYLIMVLLFLFCYWRILVTIRRQASVMSGYAGPGPSNAQVQSNKMQSSVSKTMILVCAFFAISWMPLNLYYCLVFLPTNLTFLVDIYNAFLFISFLYFCTNPFIYAFKFDPVKEVLLRLIPRKKTTQQANENVQDVGAQPVSKRTDK